MATTREGAYGGGGGGGGTERERRTTSSLNPPPPQPPKKTAPKPSPSPSQTSSASSQKPLPNYLRPTISSSSSSSSTTPKPSLDRRRSSNKPPSPLPAPKNPRPTSTQPTRAPQRAPSSLSSRPAKAPLRRSISAKVSPSNSSISLNKRPRSVTSESSVEFEVRDKDDLDHVIGGEDETRCDGDQHEVQSLPDISEMPDQEEKLGDPETVEAKSQDDVYISTEGMRNAVAEQVGKVQEIEGSGEDRESEPVVAEEEKKESIEEIVETIEHVKQGEGVEEIATKEDSTKVDEKHVVVELEVSAEGSKQGEEASAEAVQLKIESPPPVKVENPPPVKVERPPPVKVQNPPSVKVERPPPKKPQPAKKGNEVIEETTSKLMGGSNKVRALAGAFDKVISLQDTTK